MDPLSEIVTLLKPHAVVSKPITGRGRWGVSYEAYHRPGFCLILRGKCWLDERLLEAGDFVLLPSSPAFALRSQRGVPCRPVLPSSGAVHHGSAGEPDVEMFGGTFEVAPPHAPQLLELLPGLVHIRARERDTSRLQTLARLLRDELAAERPGRDLISERLLEVMLIEGLRWGQESLPPGLLNGMRDPAVATTLRSMHADVRHPWTVAELAGHASLSRSAYAKRFTEAVGCAPREYLSRWRMTLAQDALARGGTTLERVAEMIGYESASAFSTAFRRRVGCAPGAFSRDFSARPDRLSSC